VSYTKILNCSVHRSCKVNTVESLASKSQVKVSYFSLYNPYSGFLSSKTLSRILDSLSTSNETLFKSKMMKLFSVLQSVSVTIACSLKSLILVS